MAEETKEPVSSTETGANEAPEKAQPAEQLSGRARRRSPWASSYVALQYVAALPRKNFRKSDYATDILVLICLFFAVVLIFLPPNLLKPPILLAADLAFFVVIVMFIMKRLGILITLSERQAVLVWDIVIGSLLLGILLCFNALIFIAYMTLSPG